MDERFIEAVWLSKHRKFFVGNNMIGYMVNTRYVGILNIKIFVKQDVSNDKSNAKTANEYQFSKMLSM